MLPRCPSQAPFWAGCREQKRRHPVLFAEMGVPGLTCEIDALPRGLVNTLLPGLSSLAIRDRG